jgi:hypothetical protein
MIDFFNFNGRLPWYKVLSKDDLRNLQTKCDVNIFIHGASANRNWAFKNIKLGSQSLGTQDSNKMFGLAMKIENCTAKNKENYC